MCDVMRLTENNPTLLKQIYFRQKFKAKWTIRHFKTFLPSEIDKISFDCKKNHFKASQAN